jgi:hypothetical protein
MLLFDYNLKERVNDFVAAALKQVNFHFLVYFFPVKNQH